MMRALIKISVQDVNQVVFPFCLGVTERPRCNRFENIIVGSLLYIVLNSGLTMMGFSTQMMQLIQGIVFLIFVAVFADRESIQVIK